MQLKNIESVNPEDFQKVLQLLRWKLSKKKLDIDVGQISRYLEVSLGEAESILEELVDRHMVHMDIKMNCPDCKELYTIECLKSEIVCRECGAEFVPEENRHLWHYYFEVNQESNSLTVNSDSTDKQRRIIEFDKYAGKGAGIMGDKVKVFLSYSHKDEEYKVELDNHLAVLKRLNKIETWNDRKLFAGSALDESVKKNLNEANIIILLISSDFIASNYCYEIEMKNAIERAKNGECCFVPVIVRSCLWQETELGDFLATPTDGKAISSFSDRDEAYTQVVKAIRDLINSFE